MSVRRAGRLPIEHLVPWLLGTPEPPVAINWGEVFGNDNPVEIEVGFGKGLFLVNAAFACPGVNFLGVEILRKYQLYAATRLTRRGIQNVRLAKADARLFLRDRVAPASVQAVHVFFPDPWWKRRHHKRRVFTPEFAAQCERVLQPGGQLHLVTDVAEYFAVMTGLIAGQPALRPMPPTEMSAPGHDLDYLTNFERKFRKEGRPIYRARYER